MKKLGQKREVNAELNLTPFIDLLSTCVCFLLITAVWIEIGKIEIKQSHGTQASEVQKESYDLDLVFTTATSLNLNLKKGGKTSKSIKLSALDFNTLMSDLSNTLSTQFLKIKEQAIEISAATVTPKVGIDYGGLVQTLDALREQNITNIGVVSVKGN